MKKKKNIWVFDLDGTTIDSTHRQITNPDGTLNLDLWRHNSTRSKIFKDKLLPLGEFMRMLVATKDQIVWICTARELSKDDLEFLDKKGLLVNTILSRKKGDTRKDWQLKRGQLKRMINLKNCSADRILFYDDNSFNRKAVKSLGIRVGDQHGNMR